MSKRTLAGIFRAASWSVECNGQAIDDARLVRGMWYYRDPISREYRELSFCREVITLFMNSTVDDGRLGLESLVTDDGRHCDEKV